jgi:aldehyde dehydrogenase (NAD+)
MNWDYAGKLQKAQMDLVEIEAQRDFRLEERAF